MGFPGGASGKEDTCQCRRHEQHGFDLWVGKISWSGNGTALQYSCLENPVDRGAEWAKVHGGHKKSDTTERLSTYTFIGSIQCAVLL